MVLNPAFQRHYVSLLLVQIGADDTINMIDKGHGGGIKISPWHLSMVCGALVPFFYHVTPLLLHWSGTITFLQHNIILCTPALDASTGGGGVVHVYAKGKCGIPSLIAVCNPDGAIYLWYYNILQLGIYQPCGIWEWYAKAWVDHGKGVPLRYHDWSIWHFASKDSLWLTAGDHFYFSYHDEGIQIMWTVQELIQIGPDAISAMTLHTVSSTCEVKT